MSAKVEKIYSLKLSGEQEVINGMARVNQSFDEARKRFQALKNNQPKNVLVNPTELAKERQALLEAEKALLKETTAKIKARAEAQALIAARQQERNDIQKTVTTNKNVENSYNEISRRVRELKAQQKTGLDILNIDEAELQRSNAEIRELQDRLNAFNRSMSSEGTNVGEYTRGIINALKESGLDEIIQNQVDKSKVKIQELDQEFEEIKNEIRQIGQSGNQGFEQLERRLIENRNQAENLREEIGRIETEINSMGNMGNQITASMGRNFQSLRGHLNNLVLGYIGLQAVMSKVQNEVSEGIKSAKEMVGVEQAFNRLNDPNLLNNLRDSVKGTVSDLELMKAAVQADNFGIPVKNLAGYLEFAKRRADDTGQSVDYLVNSIVTGIGRKSPLILDNLGISAVRLKKELGGVAGEEATVGKVAEAVGRIIQQENAKAGAAIETVTTKLDQNKANWENLRTEIGEKALPVLAETGAILFSIVSFITGIPFPFWIAGLVAITATYVSANAQIILNRLATIQATVAQNSATVSTRLLAAAQLILSNNLNIAAAGFRTLFAVIKGNPLTALILILAGVLLWIGRIVSQNERAKKSFESVGVVLEKIISIFATLFGTIAERLAPVMDKWITEFIIPLIEKYVPHLVLQLRILAGTLNVLAGEFLHALRTGYDFAKGFVTIWEGIKNMDINQIKQGIAEQGQTIYNAYKDTWERIKKNFWEGFSLETPPISGGGNNAPSDDGGGGKDDKNKLSDTLNKIDAERDRLLAIQKQKRLKDEIDEETYLKNILKINNDAIAKKLSIIKGANAEERKMIEELKAERIQNEVDTNNSIYELRKKALDDMLATEQANAQSDLNKVINNPNSTPVQREQAEQDYYTRMLELQLEYNNQMDLLEKEFSQKSMENANERANALEQINQDLAKNTYELTEAMFQQSLDIIERVKNQALNTSEILAQEQRLVALKNQKLSSREREIELDKIYFENQLSAINAEIEAQKKLILVYVQRYGTMAMINQEVQNALVAIKQLEADAQEILNNLSKLGKQQIGAPSDSNTQQLATDGLINAFDLEESDYGELIGYALAQSFDIATMAMNNYFEAEAARIEKSKELAYARIDLEKQQLLAQAQSNSERETIERQAAQKKRQAEKEAGERLKKIKKAEAKIAFAMELANIWSTVWQLGPIAGAIMGGVLSVLAGVKFAMTMNNIDKAQYGKGGFFKRLFGNGGFFGRMFGSGGKLNGPSHSENNGMPVVNPKTGETQAFLEGGEGIVNKRSMADNNVYTVTGTPGQIASRINKIGGGIDFLGGATMKRFAQGGMYLGSQVQPPVFNSYYDQASANSRQVEYEKTLEMAVNLLAETNQTLQKEVNRKTVVSSKEITNVQNEDRKQSEIATL